MARSDDNQSGAILIEVLAALAIVTVMAVLMTSFFSQFRTLSRITDEVAARTEMEAAIAHISRAFASARDAGLPLSDTTQTGSFSGTSSAVEFSSVTRRGFFSMALRRMSFFLEPHAGGYQLVQTLAPMRVLNNQPLAPVVRVVLQDQIEKLEFEYADANGLLSASWNAAAGLPAFVRIGITRQVGSSHVVTKSIARIK